MSETQQPSRLEQVLLDTEELLGIRITIHDSTAAFRNPEGQTLLEPDRMWHRFPWCHPDPPRCRKDCMRDVGERSRAEGRPWLHVCWNGIAEVVVPVSRYGAYVITLFAGAFRPPPEYGDVSTESPADVYAALPAISTERARRIGSTLMATGQGLLTLVEELHRLDDSRRGRWYDVRRFFHYYATQNIRLGDLAAFLNLSAYRTSHLVKELFGLPFRTLLLEERIRRARTLLVSGMHRTVGDVARQVGMPDEYHFNRMFRKIVGVPPGKYRKANLKKTDS